MLYVKGSPYIRYFDEKIELCRQTGIFFSNLNYDLNNLKIKAGKEESRTEGNEMLFFESFQPFLKFTLTAHFIAAIVFLAEVVTKTCNIKKIIRSFE